MLEIDYTSPKNKYTYDLNNNQLFKGDARNYINSLGRNNMNTLGNVSLLDIFLSKGKYVEPHIHQNASELVYCVSGSAVVSFINPFTNQLMNFPIKPGQVANVPQGFWHYEVASEDNTHLLAIFDAPYPQAIFGSDILRLTPANVMADTYCLDERKWKEDIAPIKKTVIIGPSNDCNGRQEFEPPVMTYQQQLPAYNPYAAQYYNPQGHTQYPYPAQYNPYY
ncbi:cupin domain-containing protein [Metabacillus idriensis]|uniref:cupin domain-containing protein n=1 Tax=Metabacillus idriensis TaxID=324768 RepID=UPI003D2B3153